MDGKREIWQGDIKNSANPEDRQDRTPAEMVAVVHRGVADVAGKIDKKKVLSTNHRDLHSNRMASKGSVVQVVFNPRL